MLQTTMQVKIHNNIYNIHLINKNSKYLVMDDGEVHSGVTDFITKDIYIRNDLNIHNDLLSKEGYDYFKEKQAEFYSIMNTIDSSYEERMNDFLSALDRTKITSDSNEKEKILNFLNK